MHKSSLQHMAALIDRHLPDTGGRVLEVGASSPTGSFRSLFQPQAWRYTGLDLAPGPNVDLVATEAYDWAIPDAHYDLIISGQVFEHVEFFWLTILEMRRVLKPGGLIFLIVPSRGLQHRQPVDCWRFYPDAHGALAKWAGLELLEVNNPWQQVPGLDFSSMYKWGDCIGVFRVPVGPPSNLGADLKAVAKAHLARLKEVAPQQEFPVVKQPRPRHSYLSFSAVLKSKILKRWPGKG